MGGVSNFSSDQTLHHNASLQVCVLLGILGLDQSNTDQLVLVCAASLNAQSRLDLASGVSTSHDAASRNELASSPNSIVQSDLLLFVSIGVGLRIDDSLDSRQGVLSSLIHVLVLLGIDAHLGQSFRDVLALDAVGAASQNRQCQNAGEGDGQKLLCHFHDFCLHNYE